METQMLVILLFLDGMIPEQIQIDALRWDFLEFLGSCGWAVASEHAWCPGHPSFLLIAQLVNSNRKSPFFPPVILPIQYTIFSTQRGRNNTIFSINRNFFSIVFLPLSMYLFSTGHLSFFIVLWRPLFRFSPPIEKAFLCIFGGNVWHLQHFVHPTKVTYGKICVLDRWLSYAIKMWTTMHFQSNEWQIHYSLEDWPPPIGADLYGT